MAIAEPSTVGDVRNMVRSRRARSWAYSIAATILAAALVSPDWQAILIVVPSVLLATLVLLRIDEEPNLLLVGVTAAVGLATLLWSALALANPAGSVALAVAAGAVIDARVRRRALWATAVAGAIGALSALAFTTGSPNAAGTVLQLTFIAAVWLSSILEVGSERRLFALLERAKDAERELSLARERQRFAADLHDIQGHTLHVIKLKAAVAAKLRTVDPERTAQELAAIQQLTAETITSARELAADRHALSFSEELDSSVDLLTAAGAATSVHRPEGTPDPEHGPVLARVLREATTNILRHSRPERVQVVVGQDRIAVTNDGVPTPAAPPALRGLDTLRRRLRANDGELELRHGDGTVTLTARLTAAG